MKLLAAFAAVLFLHVLAPAHAAEGQKYAVLSLVGDRLMLVQRVPAAEAQPERNIVEFLDLPDKVFDQTVRLAANEVLLIADRNSKPVMLDARDPSLYQQQARLLEEGASVRRLLAGTGATHLILVTRLRQETMLQSIEGHLGGSGALEGLGFYMDRSRPLIASTTGEAAFGFLGPFAYFQITVYDVARGRVLRQEQVTASRTISAGRSPTGDPWQVLTPREKVVVLQKMLTEEIAKTLPRVVRSIF
jgi:hypothetical protein